MKIAFGALSFELESVRVGEKFKASDGTDLEITELTPEYCAIHFSSSLSTFTHKYPMPYRLLDKYEQLELF